MALTNGELLELLVEKPVSGGRMLARHQGEIVLVAGAIPGERITARVSRADKRMAFADAVEILEASPDRRETAGDPSCGGCVYATVRYERQLQMKGEIVRDTFARIGRMPITDAIEVMASPEREYRMRARFHVVDGKPSFFREGTHEQCDPRQTGQMSEAAVEAVEAAVASLAAQGLSVGSVELAENLGGDQRALHLELESGEPSTDALERVVTAAGLTGCTVRTASTFVSAGEPVVSDPIRALTGGRAESDAGLRRHPEAFFQANRFLVGSLAGLVIDSVPPGPVLDLYAGVGLFSVGLAAAGREHLHAVEGDPVSGRDLVRNAAPFHAQLRVTRGSVEAFLAGRRKAPPATVIVDPPRTGMSKEAAGSLVRLEARRIVFVSCDPATMARDSRRLLDAGYRLLSLKAFDLFPNTPHVETIGVFER